MRQIEFRAWDGKQMGEVVELRFPLMPGLAYMQFTGMRDRQGVKIFEGDILKFVLPKSSKKPNGGTHYHEVYFNGDKGQWYMARYNKSDILVQPLGAGALKHEIVGNVFENLKLLSKP